MREDEVLCDDGVCMHPCVSMRLSSSSSVNNNSNNR